MGTVQVERIGDVALVRFANPGKRNALDLGLIDMLARTFVALPAHGVRAAVLTGEAEGTRTSFSSGFDIGALTPNFTSSPLTPLLDVLVDGPIPVVAALGGLAFGGGCALAVHCDLRVAHPAVQLSMPPARLGIVYPARELARFVSVIGASRARELFFVGQPISAARALEWGLVDRVTSEAEVLPSALAIAEAIAENAPLAIAGMRRSFERLVPTLTAEVAAELDALARQAWQSEDAREAQTAFAERRKPRFIGR